MFSKKSITTSIALMMFVHAMQPVVTAAANGCSINGHLLDVKEKYLLPGKCQIATCEENNFVYVLGYVCLCMYVCV